MQPKCRACQLFTSKFSFSLSLSLSLSGLLALTAFLLLSATATATATASAGGTGLTVSFIDVGQGDAALLHDSAGCNVLIDGGKPSAGPVVVAYLRAQGVSRLDTMVATHADSDHIGGLINVLQAGDISVTQVLYNGYTDTSTTWSTFAGAVVSKGLTLTVAAWPATYTWCATQAQVLNPSPSVPFNNDNDASVVIMAQHGHTRYLFTGDISSNVDTAVISRMVTPPAAPPPIDVLKVSHHGSAYATSPTFLSLARPKVAVISVGPNSYGHPATETLQRLGSIGALVYRTDLSGTITLGDTADYSYSAYLPVIASPPAPMPGYNVQCSQSASVQICASVSDPNPVQNESVTVYGRLRVNGVGQAGQTMNAVWHYKSSTPSCSGMTGSDGVGSCSRQIGLASIGYTVTVNVSISGYAVNTSFTPIAN
jgi:beta-lactamase superfamily II metal-dependent hydrolase